MHGFVSYKKGCTRLAAASDKIYQLLAHGRWFSPGTPASSITKTGRHDIAEILLKVALSTRNQIKSTKNYLLGIKQHSLSHLPLYIFLSSEYNEFKKENSCAFFEMVRTPSKACEITLQVSQSSFCATLT